MNLKDRLRQLINRTPAVAPTVCTVCNKRHESWPAIAFLAPQAFIEFSDAEKAEVVKEKNDDFCVIEYPDQTDRFIRAVLFQQVKAHCEALDYGVWVTLSAKSFEDYNRHFFDEDYQATYFGYLGNHIPPYPDALGVHCNVVCTGGGQRPQVIPHENQRENISFVEAYYAGILIEDAEERIRLAGG